MAEFDPDAFLAKQDKRKERNTGFDPDAFLAKTKPETAAQTFGRSAASLADTALNAITGTLDYGAYALARAAGRTPEQATAETTSPKDVVGRAFGVTGTAGYENAPLRSAGRFIGEQLGENVIQPVASATGIPEQDVGNMLNSLAMGVAPVAGKVAAPVARTAAKVPGVVAQVPGAVADVGRGAYGAFTGKTAAPGAVPEPWQQPSVRQPVSKTYYTPEQITAWRAGELPTEQLTPQPIENLGPQAMAALQKTEGNVPYTGQGFRAFGEQLGETYRNPLNLLTDVGLDVLTSGGLPTMGRMAYKGVKGAQGAKAAKTLEGAGFTPLYPEELAALKSGEPHPSVIGPVTPVAEAQFAPVVNTQPLLPYTPAGQTAMPMPGPGRRVNIEGESFNLPYQIDTSRVQAARPQQAVGPVAPVPEAQPAPAVTTQPVKPLTVEPTIDKTPEQLAAEQALLDLINSRRGAAPEPTPEPKPEPKKRISQEQRIREREAEMTPEELAAQEAQVQRQLAKSSGKKPAAEPKQQYESAAEMRKALYGKMPNDELEALVNKTFPSVNTLKEKMNKSKTEENKAMDEALRQKLEALKQQGKYRGPKDTSQMMTDKSPNTTFSSKEDFKAQQMMDTLRDQTTTGTYPEGKNIVSVEQTNPFATANLPSSLEKMLKDQGRLTSTSKIIYEPMPKGPQKFGYDPTITINEIQKNTLLPGEKGMIDVNKEIFHQRGVDANGNKVVLKVNVADKEARLYIDKDGKLEFARRYDLSKKPKK